jgi:hypothetical protein
MNPRPKVKRLPKRELTGSTVLLGELWKVIDDLGVAVVLWNSRPERDKVIVEFLMNTQMSIRHSLKILAILLKKPLGHFTQSFSTPCQISRQSLDLC